jgi:hypothetical protein
MAGFDTHFKGGIVAGLIGGSFGVGGGYLPLSLLPVAVGLAGLGGLLPDLDESNSIPARIVQYSIGGLIGSFGVKLGLQLTPAPLPPAVGGAVGGLLLFFGTLFLLSLLQSLFRHRGVFHSVPMGALLGLWGGILLHWGGLRWREGLLLGLFLTLGFLSHLLLDELHSIQFRNRRVKRSFGTAFKFWAPSPAATSLLYILLGGTLLYLLLQLKG